MTAVCARRAGGQRATARRRRPDRVVVAQQRPGGGAAGGCLVRLAGCTPGPPARRVYVVWWPEPYRGCMRNVEHTHTHIHSSINVNKAVRVGARRAAARPALQRPYIAPPTAATAPPRPPLSLPPPLTFFTSSSSPDYFIKTCRQGRRRLPVRGLARRGTDRHGRSARAGCRRPRRRRR